VSAPGTDFVEKDRTAGLSSLQLLQGRFAHAWQQAQDEERDPARTATFAKFRFNPSQPAKAGITSAH